MTSSFCVFGDIASSVCVYIYIYMRVNMYIYISILIDMYRYYTCVLDVSKEGLLLDCIPQSWRPFEHMADLTIRNNFYGKPRAIHHLAGY